MGVSTETVETPFGLDVKPDTKQLFLPLGP